ncbi:Bor/Iss family lipoprotein [Thalassotalea maritima]|uniref:Bor/Iss family lipoprotein n=1 Tax=Thalassotalea maritima TaxID=3242416 RepID=UPI003527B228
MKKLLILIAMFSMSACTTIHFDKTPIKTTASVAKEQWHHNFILALYEGSSPVDLKSTCDEQEWVTVKTETSFVNGLADFGSQLVIGPLWSPRTVSISCNES